MFSTHQREKISRASELGAGIESMILLPLFIVPVIVGCFLTMKRGEVSKSYTTYHTPGAYCFELLKCWLSYKAGRQSNATDVLARKTAFITYKEHGPYRKPPCGAEDLL